MPTYLLLIPFISLTGKDETNNIKRKQGAHCCQDVKVVVFSNTLELTKHRLEVYLVWWHEKVSTKRR